MTVLFALEDENYLITFPGTNITVREVRAYLEAGNTVDEAMRKWPDLEPEQIDAAARVNLS